MIHKYCCSFADQLKVENVDENDVGEYHCMIGTFLNFQMIKSTQVISVVGEHEDISTVEQVPDKRH